jgi:hypothetical protein
LDRKDHPGLKYHLNPLKNHKDDFTSCPNDIFVDHMISKNILFSVNFDKYAIVLKVKERDV